MTWTAPMTAVANSVFTAAQFNTYVRDNLNETAPAKASAAGQIFVATAANAIAARTPSTAGGPGAGETTTSTSYTDLTTSGPAVTVTTGTSALVIIAARMTNTTSGSECAASYEVSGATTSAASDARALAFNASSGSPNLRASAAYLHTGLTAGSNTFTMKYRVSAGTGTFTYRNITVIPF